MIKKIDLWIFCQYLQNRKNPYMQMKSQKNKFSKNWNYLARAQLPQNFMYIEKLPTITLSEIIADTKWIYATYRIFGFSVKP